jgi:hypothetical protein
MPPGGTSAAEGRAMVAAADHAGVKLMVGYPKRYDPAFARMREETARLTSARMLRVTTFESPLRPYIAHYPLLPRAPLQAEVAAGLRADSDERIKAATGAASDLERQVYEMVLLDTLVHELNTVRGPGALRRSPATRAGSSLSLRHSTTGSSAAASRSPRPGCTTRSASTTGGCPQSRSCSG